MEEQGGAGTHLAINQVEMLADQTDTFRIRAYLRAELAVLNAAKFVGTSKYL